MLQKQVSLLRTLNSDCILGYTEASSCRWTFNAAQSNFHAIQTKTHPVLPIWVGGHPPPVHQFSSIWKLDFSPRYIDSFQFLLYFSGYVSGFPPEGQDTIIKNGRHCISLCIWDKRWKTAHKHYIWSFHKPFPKSDLPAPVMKRSASKRITGVQRYSRERIARRACYFNPSTTAQQQPEHRFLRR